MKTLSLDLSKAHPFGGQIFEDLSFNGLMVRPEEDSDAPCPWDAGVEVTDLKINIEGGAGPSGYGTCLVTIPKDHKGSYVFVLEVVEENESEVIRLLEEYNIGYEETVYEGL
jgi:hypothetical protein